MKFRCPYCKKIIEAEKAPSLCPHCKKSMTIPDTLRKKQLIQRKADREKLRKAADRERKRIFAPNFKFGRDPSTMLLVLAILFLVGGAIVMQSTKNVESPKLFYRVKRAQRETTVLRIALERFKRDVGRYPLEEEGLVSLSDDPGAEVVGWGGTNRWRYINTIQSDPWEMPYRYQAGSSNTVKVSSLGPDRTPDTEDDIVGDLPEDENVIRPKKPKIPDAIPVNIGGPPA